MVDCHAISHWRPMQIDVPSDVLEQASKCKSNYSCIETRQCGDVVDCEVNYANGRNVLFLKSDKTIQCPYRLIFGGATLCHCPVHFYLYTNKYI